MGKKKHYCEECGKVLSDYEYAEYDTLCERCYLRLTEYGIS